MKRKPLMLFFLVWPLLASASGEQNFRMVEHQDDNNGLGTRVMSEAQEVGKDHVKLWYVVCNVAADSLIFRWVQPGFGNGFDHPLTRDECAVYQSEAKEKNVEVNTDILYTQRGVTYNAAAFMQNETSNRKSLSEWITSLGKAAKGTDYKQPNQYYDLKIQSINKGSEIKNKISWSANIDTVLIKLADTSEQKLKDIDNQLSRQKNLTSNSKRVSASDLNPPAVEGGQFPGGYPDGEYARLQAKDEADREAEIFMFLGERTDITTVPVYLLDKNGKIVWSIKLHQ